MISEEFFQDDQQSKEKTAHLYSIRNSPNVYIYQYFDDLTLQIDIYAEKLIGQKSPCQSEDVKAINQARQLMLEQLSVLCTKLAKESNSVQLEKIIDTSKIDDQILLTKKILFSNKWIFFHPNKNLKPNQNDFGRLVIIEHVLNDNLTKNFCKVGNLNINSANLKRFILSKNGNNLCSDYLKLYTISKLISENLKDSKKLIIQIEESEIFNIEELNFERYELVSVEQLVKPNEKWTSLRDIDLNHNKIKNISINSFSYLNSLKCLNLSFNKLEVIGSNWFKDLSNLEHLDLSNNRITSLDEQSFVGLKCLKHLDLSGNSLSSIPINIFQGLSNLIELDMSCNNYQIVSDYMFTGLNSLERLYLNSNEIDSIEQYSFINLINLKELHLNMNKLIRLEDFLFSDQINSLTKIDLRFNEIKSLSPKIFEKLIALKIVLLYGNIDLIHELDQRDFFRITGTNELVNYLTFDGNYYESEEEIDDDEDEYDDDDDEEMEYNSDASDSDDEKDNYDSDF